MNKKNLNTPIQSTEEAREKGRKGGIASGKARRKKRDLRFALLTLMDATGKDGQTGTEQIAAVLFKKAVEGDIKAISLISEYVDTAHKLEEREETDKMLGLTIL